MDEGTVFEAQPRWMDNVAANREKLARHASCVHNGIGDNREIGGSGCIKKVYFLQIHGYEETWLNLLKLRKRKEHPVPLS